MLGAALFPGFLAQLPVGGIQALAQRADVTVAESAPGATDIEIVESFMQATSQLDRLGYARRLIITLVCVSLCRR